MKKLSGFLAALYMVLLLSCSGEVDMAAQAESALQDGQYGKAIELYTKIRAEDSLHFDFAEKLCLAYMYRGRELYQKTRNVKSFMGNAAHANQLLPSEPSPEFREEYAALLVELADAYLHGRAKNEVEKNNFRTSAVGKLRLALQLDSSNTAATALLEKIKQDDFQKILDRAKEYFNRGRRTRIIDDYFTAEYYFRKAEELDPGNAEINSYLMQLKKIMLPVLNFREGVSVAVAAYNHENKEFTLDLRIKNYLDRSVAIELDRFTLVDTRGNAYSIDDNLMKIKELYGEKILKNVRLDQENPATEGLVGFIVPDSVKIAYLNYQTDRANTTRKYFP